MAGNTLLDAETARENRRITVNSPAVSVPALTANAEHDVVSNEINALVKSGQVPRGGFTSAKAIAEAQIVQRSPAAAKASDRIKNSAWAFASPKIQEQTFTQASQVAGAKGLKWSKTYAQYPGIALAAAKAVNGGAITRDQLSTITAAVEIVDSARNLLSANSDATRAHIMSQLSRPKQLAVVNAAIGINAELDALRTATMTNSGDQSLILQGLGTVGGAVIDTMNWLNERGQHFGRSVVDMPNAKFNPIAAWRDTEVGKFDEEQLGALRTNHGDLLVNVVQDAVRAQHQTGEFDMTDLIAKYADNQDALHIIDAIMLDSERDSVPGLTDLLGSVNAARMDNLGGMVMNNLMPGGAEGTSVAWTVGSKAINLVALMTLDPTLALGKAYRGYRALKFGLQRANIAGDLTKVYSNPASRRFIENLSTDIAKYNTASDAATAGHIMKQAQIKYGKYLTDDAIRKIAHYATVDDPKTAAYRWLTDMENFDDLLAGQAARGIRANDRVAPRMSYAAQKRVEARLAMRDAISFDGADSDVIDMVTGARNSVSDATALRSMGLDPKRVSADRIADQLQLPQAQQALADRFGIDGESLLHRIRTHQPSERTVHNRMDRIIRKGELIPRGLDVNIADGSDARTVGRWARVAFPKYFAETVEEAWVHASTADRRLMLNGLFESIARAHGIDVDEVVDGVRVGDTLLTSGSKSAEQYAATVGQLEGVRGGTPLEQHSLRLIRATLPKLPTVQRDLLNANAAKLSKFFDKQREYDATLATLGDASESRKTLLTGRAELDQRIQTAIDDIEAIAAGIKDSKGRGWGAGKALIAERKAIKSSDVASMYNPAEFGGKQHAVHLSQMTDRITVPNFGLIKQYQQRRNMLSKVIGWTLYSDASTRIVNDWSFANLIGPRYVMRNGTEDWMGYFLTGGSMRSALKGRVAAIASRDLYGRELGVVQKRTRELAESNQFFGKMFLDNMPEDDVRMFGEAIKNGDLDVAEGIAGSAIARLMVRPLGRTLTKVDEDCFRVFATTPHSRQLVDHIAEIRGDVHSGALVSSVDAVGGPRMRESMKDFGKTRPSIYSNVDWNAHDMNGYVAWSEMLQNVLHRDGKPGQIVFNAMRYADQYKGGVVEAGWDKYKQKLVDFFSDREASAEWWSKSSGLEIAGPEDFARRYFDAASNYLAHGRIVNSELVKMLTRQAPNGAKYGALYVKEGDRILNESRVTFDQLRKFGSFERPQHILGHVNETVGGTDDIGMVDKAFGYMAESLARISREPAAMANVLDEWSAAQPQVARLIEMGMEEMPAKRIVMEQVMQRAEKLTFAYIDNPNVRTQLAFNARNIARYYRATEDFFRRTIRMAAYRPDELQKANIIYQNLNNSGFVYEDDQGTQYFMYPGTGVVNEAIAKGMQALGASASIVSPFIFGGQTLMLTPSLDPNSLLPTFASPIIAPAVKALTAIGPFSWLEPVLLGSRGTEPTTNAPSFALEVMKSAMPAPLVRAWNTIDIRDRDTMLSNATLSAMRYAAYAGVYERGKAETNTDFQSRVKTEIGNMAIASLFVRFALGFATPASPQMMNSDDLSAEARQAGMKSLRTGFTGLLNKFDGDYDKALGTWFKMNPGLMPYTVASTEAVGQGYPSVTASSGKWLIQNAKWVSQHSSAAAFLSPDDGDFSFSTWGLVKSLRLIRGKDALTGMTEIFTQRSYYEWMQTKDEANAAIAAEPSVAKRNEYRAHLAAIKQQMITENPLLAERITTIKPQSNRELKQDALLGMRYALKDIYANRRNMVTDRTDRITTMLNTYDDGMAAIAKIGGNTDYESEMRKTTRAKLRTLLQETSTGDRGASDFYSRVLDPLIG